MGFFSRVVWPRGPRGSLWGPDLPHWPPSCASSLAWVQPAPPARSCSRPKAASSHSLGASRRPPHPFPAPTFSLRDLSKSKVRPCCVPAQKPPVVLHSFMIRFQIQELRAGPGPQPWGLPTRPHSPALALSSLLLRVLALPPVSLCPLSQPRPLSYIPLPFL